MRWLETGSNLPQMPSTVFEYQLSSLPFMPQYVSVPSGTPLIADYMHSDWSQDHISM